MKVVDHGLEVEFLREANISAQVEEANTCINIESARVYGLKRIEGFLRL